MSCTLAPSRTTIEQMSARSTAPYQTEAPASTTTSPMSVAVGAIHASGWTCGDLPSKANNGMGPDPRPAAQRNRVKSGGRFSAKARAPSMPSSLFE